MDISPQHLQSGDSWKHESDYREVRYRATRKLRLLATVLLLALLVVTRPWWAPSLGQSLVCSMPTEKPDLILIDNLDTNYLLFEKARDLAREGRDAPVLVPVSASGKNPEMSNPVSREFAEVMIRLARIEKVEILPVKHEEPITLNTARQVSERLTGRGVKSLLILTSGFKSKRIHLIFSHVLSQTGIETYCLPVWGSHRPENWAETWHGAQEVFLQLVKLGYYWLWVL